MSRICDQYPSGQCSFLIFLPYRFFVKLPQPATLNTCMGNREICGESLGKVSAYEHRYRVYLGGGVGVFRNQTMLMVILKTTEMYTLKW